MRHEQDNSLEIVHDIAHQAGSLLRRGRDHLGTIDFKSATDMVTDLDRRTEKLVVGALRDAFPEDGIFAEEGSRHEGASGRTWVVDPLDGTTNYVHGHPFYAVSIACVDAQGPVMGVVHAPELGEMFSARRGDGAFLMRTDDAPKALGPLAPVTLDKALLATGYPYRRDEVCRRNCRLTEDFLMAPCHGVRRGGSAALDLSFVAAGRLDGYWEFSLQPWDVAAGALIASEAGALVTDAAGGDAWSDGRHILAAKPQLHPQMLKMIRSRLEPAAPASEGTLS